MNAVERDEFEAFARARLPALLAFGAALTGDSSTGPDLVQEALTRVGMRWGRISTRGDPEAYLRTVMVRTHISWWRRRRRERLTAQPPEAADRAQPWPDPGLWALVASLPPRQRAVIVLRFHEDLAPAQVAEILACSTGTVKSQTAKALAKLRASMPAERELW